MVITILTIKHWNQLKMDEKPILIGTGTDKKKNPNN